MATLKVIPTSAFRRSYARLQRRGYAMHLLDEVIILLAEKGQLPLRYRDHALKGKLLGYRECHIRPDWLLIYRIEKDRLILVLADTGTHSELLNL